MPTSLLFVAVEQKMYPMDLRQTPKRGENVLMYKTMFIVTISVVLTLLWMDWVVGVQSILALFAVGSFVVHIGLLIQSVIRLFRRQSAPLSRTPTTSVTLISSSTYVMYTQCIQGEENGKRVWNNQKA